MKQQGVETRLNTSDQPPTATKMKKSVQTGWSGWRRATGVICDRRIAERVKGKVYKTDV